MDLPEVHVVVSRAKAGEHTAFGELYDTYAASIYRFIRMKVPQREQAEDLLQDTFFNAWRALPKLSMANLNFRALLYKIARNLVNDHYRRTYRKPVPEDLAEHTDLPDPTNTAQAVAVTLELERVRSMLPRLKAEYRQVVELRYVQEFSVEETAKIMGKTRMAVRLTQYRALKKLRNALTNQKYDAV